ncbi:hypothetical protein [Mycobacteroides immunogenum]|uniref:Recombinase RecT n=1 Tax=Mycobacteroides immunogenum TaxID=83262 RepID=A0A7V8LKR2_9MYCO|nr:hypothetical protein [Mycobacteroides immunogenum]AMT72134.1 hypothetical protein ABG82_19385 [Mycobacteroides immunogenum]ANO05265.1 hypothetical protein BAB75_19645 [Mycobacteroides immunogenum]KIU38002.1 hypothetical protein TL11_24885 [Mycobacteroides immunogenum]KPG04222.1 hypothetical protein AN909_23380 [Mycobacteroides immunogenum]KPG04860.1 hypothetical protein AN908_23830 [Mycobacteroides immunogenum]
MTETTTTGAEIAVLPAAGLPTVPEALGTLVSQVAAMRDAMELANGLCDSELVPALYRGKPGNGAVAILYGAELGLNPIQSLQQIFVVQGKPAIYARTAVALVKTAAGIVVQTVETSDERVTVTATDPRTGQVETSTWDIARAEKAKYTGNSKYQTDPQAMLYAKAAMEVCRKIAPDVLLGIPYSREELELEPQPIKVQSERLPQRAKGTSALRERAAAASGPAEQPASTADGDKPMSAASRQKWLNRMFQLFAAGKTTEPEEQRIVIAVLTGADRLPEHRDDMTDAQLRDIVTTLNNWQKDSDDLLADSLGDILCAWDAREPDSEEDTTPAAPDGEQGELGLESDQN